VATLLGHPFTRASDGSATATIRAETEVVLSGKDSVEGSLGITAFNFEQTDGNATVPLLARTVNTISFTAPAVTQETEYQFTLTVSDSDGNTSTTTANLTIEPVLDPNRFLTYLTAPATYRLVVSPSTPIAADPDAPADEILGDYVVEIRRFLTYVDRAGALHSNVPLDTAPAPGPLAIRGTWFAQIGAQANCDVNDALRERRQFELDIPALDADDINLIIQSGDRSRQLELADIDQAVLSIEVAAGLGPNGGPVPQVCVLDSSGATIAAAAISSTVEVAQLSGEADESHDTLASAEAYYRALGEEATKTTLTSWLSANGFDPAASDYGADAHAVYTNNFDLGFGRDMYMKMTCPSGSANFGECDVASVVVNYPSLENAAKKLNAINAVAMEYSASPAQAARFVKFYAYAPDPRSETGDFRRIHSVNLDGRGEKSLPGSCTVCHGGTPGGLDANGNYANNGDLNATFLLWDLNALLYSDNDPSFSPNPEDTELRTSFTRAAQEGEFRKLNAGAYLTYTDAERFALPRELVEGWYQPATLPVAQLDQVLTGTHDGTFLPAGWEPGGANGNPADSADIYHTVFAPHCRACHVMHAPNPDVGDVRQPGLCDQETDPLNDPFTGASSQLPIGCYWQFANAPSLAARLSEGVMPFARLTLDRLWVSADSAGQSAGQMLSEHLARPDTIGETVTTPGTGFASIELTDEEVADIGSLVTLDAVDQRFVNAVAWSVKRCSAAGDPSSCTIDVAVVGADSQTASVRVTDTGEHLVELRLNGSAEVADSEIFPVAETSPILADPATNSPIFTAGASTRINNLIIAKGNGALADQQISVARTSTSLVISPASCLAPSTCPGSTEVTLSSETPVTSTFTLSVQDVNDAQPVSATYNVTVQSSITAQVITVCTAANAASSAIATNCAAGSTPATQATIDLLDVNGFGGRADLRVEFPAGAQLSLTNAAGQRGTINLTGSPQRLLAYRPPARISTHDKNGQPPATGAVFDEIAYNIIRRVGGTDVETSTASLRFQVRARQSFAGDVLGSFSSLGCNGCHNGTQDGAPNFTQSADNVYAIFRNANGTFNTLLNNNAISYVTLPPTAATSSGLYCWPLINGCGTGTTHPPVSFTDAQLSVIRQWAEDGGNRF
jgi:hypothetical protein